MQRNTDIEIKPGQVWADRQVGQDGRTVVVTGIEDRPADPDNPRVRILTRTPTPFSRSVDGGKRAIGRAGSVSARTLRRNYELVDEGPQGPLESEQQEARAADALRAGNAAAGLLSALQEGLTREGGAITLSCRRGEWVCGIHFGAEEPDNPDNDMAAGAAYGVGATLIEALTGAVEETGWAG